MRVLAALFALVAVALMSLAIVGMVTGKTSERGGWVVRVLALVCFAIAVVLNVIAH
jgi:VIT1/CCC1 family predicted Fe2+/Mn2+ transporter